MVTTEVEETSAVGSNGAKVCGAAEKIAPKLARPFCYNTAYQHPSNLIFYGFRPLVFNQGTVSRQKNQAAFLRPRRFLVPPVADAVAVQAFRQRGLDACGDDVFQPYMTAFFRSYSEKELSRLKELVFGIKLYPAGATTNSEGGE